MSNKVSVNDWKEIPYNEAFDRQKQIVDDILVGKKSEQIIFCSHPPVVTYGRGTQTSDIFSWSGKTIEVNRGGRATYHGPNQLIMYPLIYVGAPKPEYTKKKFKENDLHAYMRVLESTVVDVLSDYGISAKAHPLQKQVGENQEKEATGVWVGDQKIAAIGIAVKGWVTSHGVALNLWEDEKAFQGIHPCGFRRDQVTTLESLIGKKISREEIQKKWLKSLVSKLFAQPPTLIK